MENTRQKIELELAWVEKQIQEDSKFVGDRYVGLTYRSRVALEERYKGFLEDILKGIK